MGAEPAASDQQGLETSPGFLLSHRTPGKPTQWAPFSHFWGAHMLEVVSKWSMLIVRPTTLLHGLEKTYTKQAGDAASCRSPRGLHARKHEEMLKHEICRLELERL